MRKSAVQEQPNDPCGGRRMHVRTHNTLYFHKTFHDTDIRRSRNSKHRRFDHITSLGASTTPANALGGLVPGKIHTKKGLDFKNWDQLIRA